MFNQNNLNFSSSVNNNLSVVLETAHLSQLTVVQENGESILKMSRWGRWFSPFYGWKKPDPKVEKICRELFTNICQTYSQEDLNLLSSLRNNNNNNQASGDDKDLQILFFKRFPQLNLSGAALDYSQISKTLQNHLSPQLKQLRLEKLQDTFVNSDEHKLKRKIAKACLALQCGLQHNHASKGTTGTIILKALNGKSLGVFKPGDAFLNLITRIKNFFKSHFWGQLYYLSPHPLAQPLAEVLAYQADLFFHFNLTPPSTIIEFDMMRGAFQLFLNKKSYQEGSEHVINDLHEEWLDVDDNPQKESLEKTIQLMSVFDFLIGNLDRHCENLFKKIENYDLKTTDNANSFIVRNPTQWGKKWLKNQYQWKNFPIASVPFHDSIRDHVRQELTQNKLQQFIDLMQQNALFKDFLTPELIDRFQERRLILERFINQTRSAPKDLGEIRSDEDIQKYLRPNYL